MKTHPATALLLAVSMLGSSLAFAQDRDHRDGPVERHDDRQEDRRDHPPGPVQRVVVRDHVEEERGAGPDHAFRRGGRLPVEYRNRQYVVDDWRNHHLSAPPRGYQWVQTGADYVLVAVATGIIAQVLLDH